MQVHSIDNKVIVEGNIKSMTHYRDLKAVIDEKAAVYSKIVIELVDSISITSSVIGYLSKLVNVDGIGLELRVKDENLYNLLDELGLVQLFGVRRIQS